jgi:hypothetical protein
MPEPLPRAPGAQERVARLLERVPEARALPIARLNRAQHPTTNPTIAHADGRVALTPMPHDLRHVEERLHRLLENATGLLPQRELRQLRELVAVGEPGVALEHFCAHLDDYDVSISVELSDEVEALAAAMGMRVALPRKNWTQELQDRLAAPLRVLAAEIAGEFPSVRVVESFSTLPARSNSCLLGLSCILAATRPSQPDLVDLSISVTDLTTTPRIDSADVCWGHPSGWVELEVFEEPVVLTDEAVGKLREQMPNLAAALRRALRRGRPPNGE